MPTGYTADVQSGKVTDFAEFAMNCARAFGACIALRDLPKEPIPDEFKSRTHNAVWAEQARAELQALLEMTPSQIAEACESDYQSRLKSHRETQERNRVELRRYTDMLAKVEAWNPPTADHVELKQFMLEQLRDSIKFDIHEFDEPKRETVADWQIARVSDLRKTIARNERCQREEDDRTASRNEWIAELRKSLTA